jgi:hypothetical protein
MDLSKIDFSKIIKVKASGTYVPPPSKEVEYDEEDKTHKNISVREI